MSSWFHSVKGQYSIADKLIGFDFARLFLDPIEAQGTFHHEMTHGVVANCDFGQATQNLVQVADHFQHLQKNEARGMVCLMIGAQQFVQEGFATFMQMARMRELVGDAKARDWALNKLPDEYYDRLKKFMFLFEKSRAWRDHFTGKVLNLVMETGFRATARRLDLFGSPERLKQYLANPDHSPDERLAKVLDLLRGKTWMVTRQPEEIARCAGITLFPFATKEDLAEFLTYTTSFTDRPHTYSPNDIQDTPPVEDQMAGLAEKMIVGNLNFDPASAEKIFDLEAFAFYGDVVEALLVTPCQLSPEYEEKFRLALKDSPEVQLLGFRRDGSKIITICSRQKAEGLIEKSFQGSTLLLKGGGYNPTQRRAIIGTRLPDVVIYNDVSALQRIVDGYCAGQPNAEVSYLHMGASEKHPMQTLLVKFGDQTALHIVNTFGNVAISKMLVSRKANFRNLSLNDLAPQKRHFNDLMSVWMGLDWAIDWYEVGTGAGLLPRKREVKV